MFMSIRHIAFVFHFCSLLLNDSSEKKNKGTARPSLGYRHGHQRNHRAFFFFRHGALLDETSRRGERTRGFRGTGACARSGGSSPETSPRARNCESSLGSLPPPSCAHVEPRRGGRRPGRSLVRNPTVARVKQSIPKGRLETYKTYLSLGSYPSCRCLG